MIESNNNITPDDEYKNSMLNISSLNLDVFNYLEDWVRVITSNQVILFANISMVKGLGRSPVGTKCYSILNNLSPCKNCVSEKAVLYDKPFMKIITINKKIYSVLSSPFKDSTGKTIAAIEVLRDITEMEALKTKLIEHNQKLAFDLNMAKKLQKSLFPKYIYDEKINFFYLYKPCESLSGDFFNIYKIKDGIYGAYIADVSGHGIFASMLTVFLKTTLDKTMVSPKNILFNIFHKFNAMNFDDNLYITIFCCIINTCENTLTYSNAGHNSPPIIIRDSSHEILRVPGIPISNWIPNPSYIENIATFNSKDRILLYTDGITELTDINEFQFSEDRIIDTVINDTSSPEKVIENIFNKALDFATYDDKTTIIDDITIALIEAR
jgi:phosphoserine phosphatase RsbU/P